MVHCDHTRSRYQARCNWAPAVGADCPGPNVGAKFVAGNSSNIEYIDVLCTVYSIMICKYNKHKSTFSLYQ